MLIAVISDLHLGDDKKTDQFKHDDFYFIKFLKFLESNFERIILLGDIYETLMPKHYGGYKQSLIDSINNHKEISNIFKKESYTYINGNHDEVAGKVLGIPSEVNIDVDGKRILFRHGHQYDCFVQSRQCLSELGVWLGGCALRAGLFPIWKYLAKLEEDGELGEATKFQRSAIQSAHDLEKDIIVTGHTHVAKNTLLDNKLYLNSGTCSDERYSFLSLDTKKDVYKTNISW